MSNQDVKVFWSNDHQENNEIVSAGRASKIRKTNQNWMIKSFFFGNWIWNSLTPEKKIPNLLLSAYMKPWITKGLRLDGAAIPKISKRHFFQDIWFSCQWVTGMGLKSYQNYFCKNISKIVGARPHQNFGLLKGVAAVSVVSWSKFFAQFIQGMWLTTGENFSQISQRVFELWLILF